VPRRIPILALACVLAGCASAPADRGATALSEPITSMPSLVSWVQGATGSCADPKPASPQEFGQFVGPQLASLYEPFLAEWSTCWVSPSYPKVGLVLLKDQSGFERSWRDAMTAGKVSDGPPFSFGNGFAITSGFLGVSELNLYYLRCHYRDPQVHQVPAGTEGCVYANPEHHHG
jgi:hypothetical protein